VNGFIELDANRVHRAMQLHRLSPEKFTDQLTDIGDALSCACANLALDPDADKCERLAARLNGVARHVMQLRAALLAQGAPPSHAA
jgi:hypothetical protein